MHYQWVQLFGIFWCHRLKWQECSDFWDNISGYDFPYKSDRKSTNDTWELEALNKIFELIKACCWIINICPKKHYVVLD